MSSPLLTEGIKQKAAEEVTSSSTSFKPKPFFWDSILFYLASTIFGLSVSSVVIDFFKSSENSLACFTPLENRAQYTYINSYCHKHIPIAEYFSVALAIHATALFIPHFLWKVFFSAKFDSFFSHTTKLDTLRDRDTGEYPHINYSIVVYLWNEFHDHKIILTMYVAKLLLQFLLILTSLVLNIVVFTDINFNITFECYDDNERSQLFGNVTCAYPKKLFINVLQVADYLLLTVAMMVVGYGLYWCVLFNHSSEDTIAQFCYDSCIDAKYYKSSKTWPRWNQLKNDFKFLVDLVFATNTGLGKLFNSLMIEKIISQKFNFQVTTCGYPDIKEELDQNERAFECEVICKFYEQLCKIFPLSDPILVAMLIAEGFITHQQKEKIFGNCNTDYEKTIYLLDNYILRPLTAGNATVFEKFLKFMDGCGMMDMRDVAKKMRDELSTKIEEHQKSSGDNTTDTIHLDYFRAEDKRHEKPTAHDLLYVMHTYAYRWKELGLLLHFKHAEISENIKINCLTDIRNQCSKMFDVWLNNNNPTWDQIFSAIDGLSPIMNQSSIGWNVPTEYQSDGFSNSKSLRNEIYEICREIHEEQWNKDHKYMRSAMDIACGYHSYLFDIAEWYKLVIPITLGPYSRILTDIFEIEEHSDVKIVKMPTNLFNSPLKSKQKVRKCKFNEVKVKQG